MLPLLNLKQKINSIEIKTQEELDNFEPDRDESGVFIIKTPGLKLKEDIYLKGSISLVIEEDLDFSGRIIVAYDNSRITTYRGGNFQAYQKSRIWADGKSDILLSDDASAKVYGSESVVVATDESEIESCGNFTIFLYDRSQIKIESGSLNRKIIDNRRPLNQYIFYRLNEKNQAVLFDNYKEEIVSLTDLYYLHSISRLNFLHDVEAESKIVGAHYKMMDGINTAGIIISLSSAKQLGLTTDGIKI